MATITPYVDHENVHSIIRKHGSGLRPLSTRKQTQSAKATLASARKALGDVGNKTGSLKRTTDSKKNGKDAHGSPQKAPVLRLNKQLVADTERKRSSDDDCPYIDEMPTYDDNLPDDYEDIWPKAQRLSLDDLDQLIKWQPSCGIALSEITSDDEEDIPKHKEDLDPMKYFVPIECVPAPTMEEMHCFLDDEPLSELAPLEDDFY